jgi:hypothetical protein
MARPKSVGSEVANGGLPVRIRCVSAQTKAAHLDANSRFLSFEPDLSDLWLYSRPMTEIADTFDSAFTKAVDLGNRLADRDKDADLWDIADGLLAGALQYWLYSRQPCGDPRCQDCMPISTAEGRMAELKKLVEQLAAESEYFHTPTDANAGRA